VRVFSTMMSSCSWAALGRPVPFFMIGLRGSDLGQNVPGCPDCPNGGEHERGGTLTIAWRSGSGRARAEEDAASHAGWYPVEAHERYWNGYAWSDHVRPVRSSGTIPVETSATVAPRVIEEQRSFRWLGETPEARRTRLRGIGAVLLTLVVTNGASLFFWAADRSLDAAPEVLVVQTPTGPVDVDARRHILESCSTSVVEVLEVPDDPWRWYGDVEYLLWEVEPRPGHSAMVMVNQDTGEVVCP
jgi:hypothetical protein